MSGLSDPARSRALLIGAHSFAHPDLEPLPAVAHNLARLAELLCDPGVWGLPAGHLSVLAEPDRDRTLEEVTRLAEEAEDTLLVYYAGHGFVHEFSNELYLALPRTNPQRLYSALRYQDIRELLLGPQVRARRKVVILDCCWSGLALGGAMAAGGLGGLSAIGGTFVLTATSETRTALAPPGETYTAFTGELIDALDHGVPEAPPLLTMTTLYHHLYDSLVAKGRPAPQQRNGNTAGSIALARNRYRPSAAKPEPEPPAPEPPAPVPEPAPRPRRPRPRPRPRRRTVVAASVLLVAVLGSLPVVLNLLADGGTDNGSSGGTAAHDNSKAAKNVTVKIGASVPLTGELADMGKGIRNSVELAVHEANAEGYAPGITFQVKALDDKAVPALGQQNARALVADRSVLGVVGPLNSGVAAGMQKVFADAHLTQISPANSDPALSLGADWAEDAKARPYDTYFSMVADDRAQGPAAARYLYRDDKRRKAFVVDDRQAYGATLAGTFEEAFREEGGTIVGVDHVSTGQHDFTTQVAKAESTGADVLYFGGGYVEAAELSKQLHATDPDIRLAGGDGIFTDTYAELAGDGAEDDVCTGLGAPADALASAKPFVAAYRREDYAGDYKPYGAYAYDATWALVRAVKQTVHPGAVTPLPASARAGVRAAVQKTDFDGVTGTVGFDGYGAPVSRTVTVYTLRNGSWVRRTSLY
ncbi:ABC transporter substrate-binding protein [Streptomyces sp. NPDC051636]|uniref:caspase, EACC1-associated type n=1 Tax=Streptomyces sp. NPDC051636 TaxID=3365663 RepID=UPI0037965E60